MNNLPQEYKEGFFSKIKMFFHDLLWGKKEKIVIPEPIKEIKKTESKNMVQEMREENIKNHKEEDLIDIVEKNPELVDNLTIERLEKLEDMLDKKIEEYSNQIIELKNQIA